MFGGKAANEPHFRVVVEDHNIQIREYHSYTMANVVVDEPFNKATRVAFKQLFDYISGDNSGSEKIDMTAPVLVIPKSISTISQTKHVQPNSKTAPAVLDQSRQGWAVAFVLPEGMNSATSPTPADSRITLHDVPAKRVAAIRFTGRLRTAPLEIQRQQLSDWLHKNSLEHDGDWRVAGYNPPWTLPPLRRNEIMVTLTNAD